MSRRDVDLRILGWFIAGGSKVETSSLAMSIIQDHGFTHEELMAEAVRQRLGLSGLSGDDITEAVTERMRKK